MGRRIGLGLGVKEVDSVLNWDRNEVCHAESVARPVYRDGDADGCICINTK
jgi:hypothetical protein